MTTEQLAADVSARYGVPVMQGAVKPCPANTYTWQITGADDAPTKPRDARLAFHKNNARKNRLAKSKE
jgi:hypothetical protein